jgi:hypothetical protein
MLKTLSILTRAIAGALIFDLHDRIAPFELVLFINPGPFIEYYSIFGPAELSF